METAQPVATENRRLQTLGPIAPSERILVLDILRGIALLGILIINMQVFSLPAASFFLGQPLFPDALNQSAAWLVSVFGEGKFNSIFSFLFGVGFAIQLNRAEQQAGSFLVTYLRRIFALFAFGMLHYFFLWNGDVLRFYAVLGVALLFLRKV